MYRHNYAYTYVCVTNVGSSTCCFGHRKLISSLDQTASPEPSGCSLCVALPISTCPGPGTADSEWLAYAKHCQCLNSKPPGFTTLRFTGQSWIETCFAVQTAQWWALNNQNLWIYVGLS